MSNQSPELTTPIPLLEKAIRLAVRAHATQKRKDGDIPYITHPIAVALLLAQYGFSDEVLAAALCHDVVEDTQVSAEELQAELGADVAGIIAEVTNDDSLSWVDKKKKYIETVRVGSENAKAVATADKIHNAENLLVSHARLGTEVWKLFNAGREQKLWFENAVLEMLQQTWKHPLVDEYAKLVEKLNALQ